MPGIFINCKDNGNRKMPGILSDCKGVRTAENGGNFEASVEYKDDNIPRQAHGQPASCLRQYCFRWYRCSRCTAGEDFPSYTAPSARNSSFTLNFVS